MSAGAGFRLDPMELSAGSIERIGPSVVKQYSGSPYPAAPACVRWLFAPRPLTDEAAQDVSNLVRVVAGVSADLGAIQAIPSQECLRQLKAAARAVRGLVDGGPIPDMAYELALAGDYGRDELKAGQPVVDVGSAFAWRWPLSRLRWLLHGDVASVLVSLEDGPARAALLDALGRLDWRIEHLAGRWRACA